MKQSFQELVGLVLNNHAILDKLYQQRDGGLGRGSSYHGPSPYNNKGSDDDNDGKQSEDGTPTKGGKKRGRKMGKLKKKLSWKSKNKNKEYSEYTEDDYAVNLDQKLSSQNNMQHNSGGCCK